MPEQQNKEKLRFFCGCEQEFFLILPNFAQIRKNWKCCLQTWEIFFRCCIAENKK